MDEDKKRAGGGPGSDRQGVAPVPDQAVGPEPAGCRAEVPEAAAQGVPDPAAESSVPSLPEDVLLSRVLREILRRIGFHARVEVERLEDGYRANIRSRQSTGILIGHRGATLRALQYLVRAIVRRTYPDVPQLTVDVGGYRVRRENFLRKKAAAVARIVLETRREMALDLLTEKEMELVREALRSEPGVRVYAIGVGSRRNVIVAPIHE